MKILLINHYAGSPKYGMEFRPYYLSREWVKSGHEVLIIGASYSHLRMIQPEVNKYKTEEIIDGVHYIWLNTPSYHSSVKRIINIVSFILKLSLFSKTIVKEFSPDVVIASSTYPLDIYPARKIAKRSKAKLCYEVHDLWPLSPMVIAGYSKYHPFIQVMQKAENDACKYSDKVVSLLWNSESHLKEHGLADGKFSCVPNGFSKEEWSGVVLPLPNSFALLDKLRESKKIVVGFSGGFASSGSVSTLIEAASLLKKNPYIAFVLVGNGADELSLKKMVEDDNLNNVYFLPSVEKKKVPSVIRKFDIAYMGGTHSILHQYGTSYNKLTDYLLSSKPIIQSMDEINSIVERIGCGIRVEAENSQLLAEAIKKLSLLTESERHEMGTKGYNYAVANLEYGQLAQRFIDNIIK